MTETDKKLMGKKARAAGQRFEKRVREDLEKKGWIIDKWTNNVEIETVESSLRKIKNDLEDKYGKIPELKIGKDKSNKIIIKGKLIKAKPKFVFNPQLKRRIPMGMSSGFPDFIAFINNSKLGKTEMSYAMIVRAKTMVDGGNVLSYPEKDVEIIGVESKMNGILDKEEKEKAKWLLDNKVFSKFLIAKKGEKRGEIVYVEFQNNKV